MIDLTIVIPTRNSGDNVAHTKKINKATVLCVESLLKNSPKTVNVVIASNGGDTKAFPVDGFNQNKIPVSRINLWEQGQCKAVNAAATTVTTEWMMVTNDDMVFPENWLQKITESMSLGYQCVSPKLVEPNDGAPTFIKYPCGGLDGDFNQSKFEYFAEQHVVEDENYWQPGFNLPFIIRMDLWNKIGGYDINYDPWSSNSDSDLLYKIKLAGVTPMQSQSSLVYHFSQTSGTFHPNHQAAWQKNWHYFIDKWGFERASSPEIWTGNFEIPLDKLKYKPNWANL